MSAVILKMLVAEWSGVSLDSSAVVQRIIVFGTRHLGD